MGIDRPKNLLCVDNSVLESVQTLTFSSRIKVTTLTHLDDLQVHDDCECQEVIPPPRQCKPMHLVFLIDGSDGYNEKTRNKNGYTEANAFDLTMKWVYNFINSGNFRGRNQKTFISIIQFSGVAQAVANYTPGGTGVAIPGTDDHPTIYHWTEVENTFKKPSMNFFDPSKKVDQLDGNGCLYLALQDISMRNGMFLTEIDALIGKTCDISGGIERNLIICTDEEWDIKNVKSAIDGNQATEKEIINLANQTYDRIYGVIACDFNSDVNSDLIKELRKSTYRPSRPKLYDINNKNNSFELKLMRAGDQIQIDLDISH